jgi:hypothetical protein
MPQNEIMEVIRPLILFRGAPEKVKGGKCEAAGGLLFLEIDGEDMFYRMVPCTLMFWEPGRRRTFI